MKKIIRISETDLKKIVKRVISEQDENYKKNVKNVIKSINEYDTGLLEKSISPKIVNQKIFKIFEDDKKPLWTPLIKVSTLKKNRDSNERYWGINVNKNEDDDIKLAEILINNGANINDKDRNGHTALHYCVYYKNYKLMEFLVNNGADMDVQDNNGNTPLQLSIMRKYDNFSKFLINNGADKNIKNFNGENVFNYENQ